MQPCNRIYYSKVFWGLNMFRAAHRSSSGASNCIYSLWFIYTCGDRPLSRLGGNRVSTQPGQQPVTTCVYKPEDVNRVPTQPGQRPVTQCVYKPEAVNTVWSSWWWTVCLSKHVEPSKNFGIINSITKLHLVGCFYWLGGNSVSTQPGQRPVTTCVYKPEAVNTVWSSWWWTVCLSKHVEPSKKFGIINSITTLHLVVYFYWFILRCTDQWIL